MADVFTIKCSPNGPYLLRGPAVITDPQGNEITIEAGKNVALCRCGKSDNKPFCDGTHSRAGFSANEALKGP
jgi:CDGSH iron-sulfur domain-containing protein 3